MDQQTPLEQDVDTAEDASPWEVLLYVVGIVMIPLVPILMVSWFTPFSGVTTH
jgi:hypothetical protein